MAEGGVRGIWEELEFGDRVFGEDHPPFLIAEMACSHGGDPDRARTLVDAALDSGVDAVQLQLFRADYQVAEDHELRRLLEELQLDDDEWRDVLGYAKKASGLAVFGFVYDRPSIELALSEGVDGLKLNSADLTNPEMLGACAASGLPTTIGTGASTLDEILEALVHFQGRGGSRAILMHGVQNFPTPLSDANIARVGLLRRVFGVPVGYQDHTDADREIARWVDFLALAQGAAVLEKHITLDRSERITDWEAALEPAELRDWVEAMRAASQGMGPSHPQPLGDADLTYRRFQKKTIVAARDIEPGERIGPDEVMFMRANARGLSPMEWDTVIGCHARSAIRKHTPISAEDLHRSETFGNDP